MISTSGAVATQPEEIAIRRDTKLEFANVFAGVHKTFSFGERRTNMRKENCVQSSEKKKRNNKREKPWRNVSKCWIEKQRK